MYCKTTADNFCGICCPIFFLCRSRGNGWLGTKNPNGLAAIDYAGGTVVHILGGMSGVVGAIIVGPRTGRWTQNAEGKWEDNKESGHSVVYATIGVFLLFFGWFGFNSGSTQAMSNGQYLVAGTAAVNTLIATATGGIAVTLHFIYFHDVHELWELLNGMLCGLVAITPCCATVETWGAFVIGATSVYAYIAGAKLMKYLRIDDVVDAFAVHGCCGIYGTLCAGIFSTQELCDRAYGEGRIKLEIGHQLGVQCISILSSIALSSAVQAALFLALKYTVGVRVSEGDERAGLDLRYHAGYAYPDFNQRVKKAHEQMAWEQEVAQQVRKETAAGKGKKFQEASRAAVLIPSSDKVSPSNEKEGSVSSSDGASTHARGGSVIAASGARMMPVASPSNSALKTPTVRSPNPGTVHLQVRTTSRFSAPSNNTCSPAFLARERSDTSSGINS